ncbi:hypothetical protein SCLARK_001303 [Spiroplasma clarkii]|nr:hypothetical protein SCLARK_001303 [Spiroplasma clarkii]
MIESLSFEDKINLIKNKVRNGEGYITNSTFEFFDYIKNQDISEWTHRQIQERSEYLAKEYLVKLIAI